MGQASVKIEILIEWTTMIVVDGRTVRPDLIEFSQRSKNR